MARIEPSPSYNQIPDLWILFARDRATTRLENVHLKNIMYPLKRAE
jgi:hypothetical protein